MRVQLGLKLKNPVMPAKAASILTQKAGRVHVPKPPRLKQPNAGPKNFSIFGNRAMKSPEDYETAESVQGLGRAVSPYFSQQYAQKGRSLKYDTATNTYR